MGQERPDIERAKRRKDEYNRIIASQTASSDLGDQKTSGERLNAAIIATATTVYKEQAIQAFRENQGMIHHPWDRSTQTKEIWREKKQKQAEIERIHRLLHSQLRRQRHNPTIEISEAVKETKK